MVDFPLRSVDKEVHQLKLITIITERGGVGGCSRNLCNPHSNLSGMFTGILQYYSLQIILRPQIRNINVYLLVWREKISFEILFFVQYYFTNYQPTSKDIPTLKIGDATRIRNAFCCHFLQNGLLFLDMNSVLCKIRIKCNFREI